MQTNILEYFEQGAARLGAGKTAIIDGDRSFTFAELEDYSKRCATRLIERTGGAMRLPIAVYLPKSAEVIFADLGIVYSGNLYANLDIKSPPRRTEGILKHIGPVLVITSEALAPQLEAIGMHRRDLFLIEEISSSVGWDQAALTSRLNQVLDTDPLCIINTSGSTGVPKGVVLNHRSTIDFMDWCFNRLSLDGSERIGSLSPFHFDIFTLELNLCLAKGATIVILSDQLAVFPAKLMEAVVAAQVSFLFWVPSIMVNIANQGLLERFDLSSLKTIFFAGEVFSMKHLNHWRRSLPGARFVNLYGPIEITVDCTYFPLERDFSDDEALPIGFPCRNTDILILNEQDRLCLPGERGELCVRGSSLAMGYWNDPEKTARAFVQNPLNRNYPETIYRTGDIVYLNDRSEIMLVGRKDFQIKHMGYRIELPEIEYQVLQMESIANACVLYNKTRKEITLFYEARPGFGEVTSTQIRKELSTIFPKYMLPTAFHRMDELPRNPNGKIDRQGLSVHMEQPDSQLAEQVNVLTAS